MMPPTPTTPQTLRAWNLLYARLLQEGLLAEEKTQKPHRHIPFTKRIPSVAAAGLIALVVSTLAVILYPSPPKNHRLRSLHNPNGGVTLITTLEDGSVVYLAGHTRLEYPEHFTPERREVALEGQALFDVQGNSSQPFLIQAGAVEIEVMGTCLHVRCGENSPFELAVREGEVKVALRNNRQALYATAGETVTLSPSGYLRTNPSPPGEVFGNYTQRMHFRDETLGNILGVINANAPQGPRLHTTPALQARRITVTFTSHAPENVARLLCKALNLTCEEKYNDLWLSEP
ncbi:MAG: FecR domain-containing protein [Tannerellaceae bacterium]|jgi:ferric-dicitrate binding protein FerR (iron transport regulator)|nr:FecR domain-containing protein [Tannerellaceae bacterium]